MWGVMFRFSCLFYFVTTSAFAVHIVSLDLCADQWILWLLKPEAIGSVTYLAKDPKISFYANRAQIHKSHHGTMEEILTLSPDIVISEAPLPMRKKKHFQKRGITVIELTPIKTFEDMTQRQKWFQKFFSQHIREEISNSLNPFTITFPQKYIYIEPHGHLHPSDSFLHTVFQKCGLENAYPSSQASYIHPEALMIREADLLILNNHYHYQPKKTRTTYTCTIQGELTICPLPPAIQALSQSINQCVRQHVA